MTQTTIQAAIQAATQAAPRTVELALGAPSLAGSRADASPSIVVADFADAKYPLMVEVQNHMPRDVAFPEVEGLFLRHAANPADSRKTVVIASYDLLQRLVSSVEQVAELNRYGKALTLSAVIPDGQGAASASNAANEAINEATGEATNETPSATRASRKGKAGAAGVNATPASAPDAQPGTSADAAPPITA